jgi:hypothetical protein
MSLEGWPSEKAENYTSAVFAVYHSHIQTYTIAHSQQLPPSKLKLCLSADEPAHDRPTYRQLLTVQSVRYKSHKLPLSMKLQWAASQARLEGVPGQRSIYETFLVGSVKGRRLGICQLQREWKRSVGHVV